MILSVVTPEKSILSNQEVESVVLPSEVGQLTVLPGHTDIVSLLTHGSFAYKVNGQWSWAFIEGGFAQIREQKINVLAETVEFSHEVDMAAAELDVQNLTTKLRGLNINQPEYADTQKQHRLAVARLGALKKQAH